MQYKHTFLFTMVLGLVWAGALFSYQNGPDPASNGILGDNGCAVAGCHVGNALNAAPGTMNLTGLPAEWTPGLVYPLTVTITRPGAVKYGFQLSVVSDSSNTQAGTLAAGSNRVSVLPAGGIQYAQHNAIATNIAPFTGTFAVNWTAPSSATGGAVRFHVAGNAANGNVQNTGDFIYLRTYLVSPATSGPPPNEVSFSVENRGGVSQITDGSGADAATGYVRIQPNSGNTTPAGVGIFGFKQSNVLVSEAGVPASPLITSGRIYAETGNFVRTGLAIANPNSAAATINFTFTNAAGTDTGSGSTVIAANQQIANFLDENIFNGAASFQGTFSFSSTVPVSVVALRGFTNERSQFLLTTLPIINLSAPTSTDIVYLPHFADGLGWISQVVLVNPTDSTLTGSIQFMGPGTPTAPALPVVVNANGASASSFNYTIQRRSSFKLLTSSPPNILNSGSVRVTPSGGGVAPVGLVVFSYRPVGVTVTEAGVQGVRSTAHRMYVEISNRGQSPGTIQTGLAVTNVSQQSVTVNLELYTMGGTFVDAKQQFVPGNGQFAGFVDQIFSNLSVPFKGILRVAGSTAGVSAVSLRTRYNELGDFLITTTPPTDENAPSTAAEFLFPHIVNGGGYTTQFILFSGVAGQSTSGTMRFFNKNSTPLTLTLQ